MRVSIIITVKETNGEQTLDHALCLQIWSLTRWELRLWRCKDSPAGIALRLSKRSWLDEKEFKTLLAVGRRRQAPFVTSGGFCG